MTFTKEQLREIDREGIDLYENEQRDLAAFALALLERAENAEAERDEARRELAEAEEAIRDLAWWFVDDGGDLPSETVPCSNPDCWTCNALMNNPAVLHARERGGRG